MAPLGAVSQRFISVLIFFIIKLFFWNVRIANFERLFAHLLSSLIACCIGITVLVYYFLVFAGSATNTFPIRSSVSSFSHPEVICDPTDVIWRQWTPFEAMTDRVAFIRRSPSWGKDIYAQPSASSHYDRRDTRGKWPLVMNPGRSLWHRHSSLKIFWP